MLHTSHAPAGPAADRQSVIARLAATGRNIWRRHQQAARRRATARALHGLSDQALKDIGLDRSEIESVAHARRDDRRNRRSMQM
jgi:uncharacterized protein YjiS (DUF1127 family)